MDVPKQRRWWRLVLLFMLLGLLLVGGGLVALRLYFNDAHLQRALTRTLHDKLQADVQIATLHTSLWHGVELTGLRIGPLPGFTLETLRVGRLACRWSLAQLLLTHVTLHELAIDAVMLGIEENSHGKNLAVLTQALRGNATPPEPTVATEKKPLRQPFFPVRVEVERLAFGLSAVQVRRPGQRIDFHGAAVEGRFLGQGEVMDFNVWLGLGARAVEGAASTLHVETDGPARVVDISQRLGIDVVSSGLGDIRFGLAWTAHVKQGGAKPLPPLDLGAEVALNADLLGQTLTLSRCAFRLGHGTHGDVTLRAADLLQDPKLAIGALTAAVDLDELGPLIAALTPENQVRGKISMVSEPLDADVAGLKKWDGLSTTVHIATTALDAKIPGQTIVAMDSNSTVATHAGAVDITSDMHMRFYEGYGHAIDDMGIVMHTTTPLTPWIGGPPEGVVQTHMDLRFAHARASYAEVWGLTMALDNDTPVAQLKRPHDAPPLHASLRIRMAKALSAGSYLYTSVTDLRTTAWDLAGKRSDVLMQMHAVRGNVASGKDRMDVPDMVMDMDVERRGDTYDFKTFALTCVHKQLAFTMVGGIDGATSDAPHFRHLHMAIPAFALPVALALLPAPQKVAGTLTGTFAATVDLDGTLAMKELTARAKAPAVPVDNDATDWPVVMKSYTAWLQGWVNSFEAGMPFVADYTFDLANVAYDDGKSVARGITMHGSMGMHPHGPYLDGTLHVADVDKPMVLRGIDCALHVGFDEGAMRLDWRNKVARTELANEPSAVEGAFFDVAGAYRLGGDLVVERFAMGAANRGVSVTADGVFARPLNVAATRGWTRAGMPGVETTVRWQLSVHNPNQLTLTKSGFAMGGDLDIDGTMQLVDGTLSLVGGMRMNKLSMLTGTTVVENMTGELPYDMRLYFGRRPNATVVARNLGFGGGFISMLTAAEDIRDRPARPVYYDRMRPYRPGVGITAVKLQSGAYTISDFALEGRMVDGMLLADWIAMNVLGGDIVGNMAFQLGRDDTVRGDMAFKVSNIDASYFPALSLNPGPDSELSADMRMGFLFGDAKRDLTMTMNVTKIGAKALDRFLQLLDPDAKDAKLQKTRDNLTWVRIQELAMWIRYENLNMDLTYEPMVGIPGTQIGYRPIPRELLRRYAVGDSLDLTLQPAVNKAFAALLGWHAAGGR